MITGEWAKRGRWHNGSSWRPETNGEGLVLKVGSRVRAVGEPDNAASVEGWSKRRVGKEAKSRWGELVVWRREEGRDWR